MRLIVPALSITMTCSLVLLQGCGPRHKVPRNTTPVPGTPGIVLSYDPAWTSEDAEARFTYGLNIRAPWKDGGKLFILFPEHLEYNPVGNTILRHYDPIPSPWEISPDGKKASYRVESPALPGVFVESSATVLTDNELPVDVTGIRMSMKIRNKGNDTLPVVRTLFCMQYGGLEGFPKAGQDNFSHNFIVMGGKLTSLATLPVENPDASFRGCVVKGCPQRDTRAEKQGGLIGQDMDLALSVVTSADNSRKLIVWWTPGKSMIANARIPCMHADPYFGNLKPGDQAAAEGYILFTVGDPGPVISWLKEQDKTVF